MNRLKDFAIIGMFLFGSYFSKAEEKTTTSGGKIKTESAHISWVSQFPLPYKKEKHEVLKKMVKMVIGEPKQFQLIHPIAIVANSENDFSVLDQGSQVIFDIKNEKDDVFRCFKKNDNEFSSMAGYCRLPSGEFLFTDSRLNKIYSVSEDKKHFKLLNDSLKLLQPTGIAYSPISHEVWVIETAAHRIAILSDSGKLKRTIGERGNKEGQFNFPISLCFDKKGNAYVVDAMNFRVEIFDSLGEFQNSFGQAGDGSGSMARPKGIAVDTFGNIYVVDALFNAVQLFDKYGNLLYSFGCQGRNKEQFWMPSGIYIDDRNYIYIADTYNSRIQVFKLINE
jgi:sugar lactone lactonase YvrE